MTFLILLNQFDAGLPAIIAACRQDKTGKGLSRPGLLATEPWRLASWEKETGLVWAGVGKGGVAGAMLGGTVNEPLTPGMDPLSLALACDSPGLGAQRCAESGEWEKVAPFRMVLAGCGEACLVEGSKTLSMAVLGGEYHCFGGPSDTPPCQVPDPGSLCAPDCTSDERMDRIAALFSGDCEQGTAVIMGLDYQFPPAGSLFFRPAVRGGGKLLNYSNLLRRLGEG